MFIDTFLLWYILQCVDKILMVRYYAVAAGMYR